MGLFCKKVCQIISVISASIALKLSIVCCQILMVQIEGSNFDFGNASFVSQLENCIDQVNEPV